jgi:nitronate monooxygenase
VTDFTEEGEANAGGLGMVTLTWSDDAGAVVRETAALTARPFGGNEAVHDAGVNVMLTVGSAEEARRAIHEDSRRRR